MSTGKDNSSNEYTIPDEYFMSKDIIAEQLEILEKLFPNQKPSVPSTTDDEPKSKTPAKKPKTDIQQNDRTISSPLAASIDSSAKKITADQLKKSLNDTMKKSDTLRANKDQNDGASTSKQAAVVVVSSNTATAGTSSLSNSRPSKNIHDYINVVLPKGNMAKKLEAAAPYNFFLTTITASKSTHNEPLSITFQGKCIIYMNVYKIVVRALMSNDPNPEFLDIVLILDFRKQLLVVHLVANNFCPIHLY